MVAKNTSALPMAKKMDPAIMAEAFVRSQSANKLPLLRRWRGQWYKHNRGRFVPISNEDVRAAVVVNTKQICTDLTKTITNSIVDHVLAELNIGSTRETNTWIGKPQLEGEIICFRNAIGSVDSISRNETIPATPSFFGLNATDFDFVPREPGFEPVEWLNFLSQVFESDEEIKTLRQFIGLCLTQDTSQHKILLLLGPKRSGKGTIGRVITSLVGKKNCVGPTLSGLSSNFGLQPLIGKQVAIVADARLNGRSNVGVVTERLLSISGEDELTIDIKHREAWTGTLRTRFIVMSNELPQLRDASGALPSRFIVLRTPNSFFGNEDLELGEKLEAELESIFWWAFDGLLELRKEKRLFIGKSSLEMSHEFEQLSSPLKSFIELHIEITENDEDWISTDALYALFLKWAALEGISRTSNKSVFVRDFLSAADHKPQTGRSRDSFGTQFRTIRGVKAC